MHPVISIVTPCLNAAPHLEEAIRSVMDQGYPSLEHIVVDGGSQDGTISLLRKYPHLRWISEPDDGQTDALNKGLRMANGEIVGWLNADDYYLPGALHAVGRAFTREPDADIIYGNFELVGRTGAPIRRVRNTRFDARILFFYRNFVPSNTAFWRRKVHDDGNFLDPSFKVVMDWEWWLRLAVLGYSFRFLPETLAAFRVRGDNIGTRFAHLFMSERDRIHERYAGHFSPRLPGRIQRRVLSFAYMSKRVLLKFERPTGPVL